MVFLWIGLVLFFGPHLFSAFRDRSPEKDIRTRLGYGPYMGLYSIVSLTGLVLIFIGYGAMRPAPVVYPVPAWGQTLNLILMLPALILITVSQFPAGHMKRRLKHPMLVAIKMWAMGHLLANGELNSVILFGAFLVYAVIDRIAVKRRGDNGPLDAVPDIKWDILCVFVGFAAYAAFIMFLHQLLFGVPVYAQASASIDASLAAWFSAISASTTLPSSSPVTILSSL
ncbi:MAG: NnrU family protein [Hyphomonadaceae bacterium]|nr:NnrU family protein [Hyphomonadaceae bacterium]MBC6412370.1 NnrU family protein [Hyphomonadaceae bacterium]